jgi:hypothetical protein
MNCSVIVSSEASPKIIFLNTWSVNSATWNENQSSQSPLPLSREICQGYTALGQ